MLSSIPIRFQDAGHGCDTFGLKPSWIQATVRVLEPIYTHYFRVTAYGEDHLPAEGPAVLASNHSGTLPLDGVMLYLDVLRHTHRIARPIADFFVPRLPVISTFFARNGVVSGSRSNARHLLERGEMLMIFPEGTEGIGKPWSERYQLQTWRVGHVELAIRHQVPVVPVGIVGAEEQMPQLARLPISLLGAPYLPIPATLIPFPVRYHILYGEPLSFEGGVSAADDPEYVERCAKRVKHAVEELLQRGLTHRLGVFA